MHLILNFGNYYVFNYMLINNIKLIWIADEAFEQDTHVGRGLQGDAHPEGR